MIVRRREYIGDVIAPPGGGFSPTGYSIQPALESTFEWLSRVAQNFEQSHIRGMVFEFRSTSCDALTSTNTALGTVIMATEYNALNAIFATKSEMENYSFCTSAKPSVSFIHPIECSHEHTPVNVLYNRSGAVPPGADIRLYDIGTFYIATSGGQNTVASVWGELWVTYDIELIKPKLPTGAGSENAGASAHFRLSTVRIYPNSNGPTSGLAEGFFGGSQANNTKPGQSIVIPQPSPLQGLFFDTELVATAGPGNYADVMYFPVSTQNQQFLVIYTATLLAATGNIQVPTWNFGSAVSENNLFGTGTGIQYSWVESPDTAPSSALTQTYAVAVFLDVAPDGASGGNNSGFWIDGGTNSFGAGYTTASLNNADLLVIQLPFGLMFGEAEAKAMVRKQLDKMHPYLHGRVLPEAFKSGGCIVRPNKDGRYIHPTYGEFKKSISDTKEEDECDEDEDDEKDPLRAFMLEFVREKAEERAAKKAEKAKAEVKGASVEVTDKDEWEARTVPLEAMLPPRPAKKKGAAAAAACEDDDDLVQVTPPGVLRRADAASSLSLMSGISSPIKKK